LSAGTIGQSVSPGSAQPSAARAAVDSNSPVYTPKQPATRSVATLVLGRGAGSASLARRRQASARATGLCRPTGGGSLTPQAIRPQGQHNREVGTIGDHDDLGCKPRRKSLTERDRPKIAPSPSFYARRLAPGDAGYARRPLLASAPLNSEQSHACCLPIEQMARVCRGLNQPV
jgi:hypothetical protein